MKKREILTDPNPILRAEAETVTVFDGQIQDLIDDMIYTMRTADGIGLAAPQVGVSKKIIVAEFDFSEENEDKFPLLVVVNPTVETLSDEQQFMVEGCLSFPGKELYVKRPKKIRVTAQDRWGKKYTIENDKLLARVLQHEIDHLNGVLMIDHIKTVKTIFVGNGTLGLPALERITNDPQFELQAVVTSQDRPSGRKNKMQPTPVARLASGLGVKLYKFDDINSKIAIEKIRQLHPEIIILSDFSQIISKELINLPKFGILNIHPSLLPKYRGPTPVATAILNGDKTTGVTIIKLNEKIDAGEILSQLEIKITPSDNNDKLKKRLAEYGADLLAETVPYYIAGEIQPSVQKEEKTSMTKKFNKNDGKIVSQISAEKIIRMIKAFTPWPGVFVESNGKKILITKAHLDRDKKLVIDSVKPEGKSEMKYQDFLLGNKKIDI